jgi:hypothetical protein
MGAYNIYWNVMWRTESHIQTFTTMMLCIFGPMKKKYILIFYISGTNCWSYAIYFCKLCLRLRTALLCWFSLSSTTRFGLHGHLQVWRIFYFHMLEGFWFAAFFCLFSHVVTLCIFPFVFFLYFPSLFLLFPFVCVCLLAFSLLFVCIMQYNL